MLEESHRGHLKFSGFDEVVVAEEVVAVVVLVVEEEEEWDGEGEREGGVASKTPPLMEIFLSPAIRPAPPNSSWIIFFLLL